MEEPSSREKVVISEEGDETETYRQALEFATKLSNSGQIFHATMEEYVNAHSDLEYVRKQWADILQQWPSGIRLAFDIADSTFIYDRYGQHTGITRRFVGDRGQLVGGQARFAVYDSESGEHVYIDLKDLEIAVPSDLYLQT